MVLGRTMQAKVPLQEAMFCRSRYAWNIARTRGRLALFVPGMENPPESLFIYTPDSYEDGGVSSWTRHAIPYPAGFDGSSIFGIFPVGNLPIGHLLFINTELSQQDSSCSIKVYSYDHHSEKFQNKSTFWYTAITSWGF